MSPFYLLPAFGVEYWKPLTPYITLSSPGFHKYSITKKSGKPKNSKIIHRSFRNIENNFTSDCQRIT